MVNVDILNQLREAMFLMQHSICYTKIAQAALKPNNVFWS